MSSNGVKEYLEGQIAHLKANNASIGQTITELIAEIAQKQDWVDKNKSTVAQNEVVISALMKLTGLETDDNRPKGWQNGYAFYVPSRSRFGKGHEITGAYRVGGYEWSCNCENGKFRPAGEACWAIDAVKAYVRNGTPLPFGAKRMYTTLSATANAASLAGKDFGLIKWDAA